jgi:tetratricopeptide (TPR) repeat protein
MSEAHELIAEGVRAERLGALDRALEAYQAAATSAVEPAIRAEALTRQADVFRTQCSWDLAVAAAREAQEVARLAGLSELMAEAMIAEANVHMSQGDFSTAMPKLQEIASTSNDPRLRGIALQNIGSVHAQSGQPRAAERAFGESLGNFHKAGYSRGEAIALNNLGRLALDSNDPVRARPLLERALGIAREVEDSELCALAGLNLASALCAAGEVDYAQDLAMSALGYFAGCHNSWREIECLRLIGDINLKCEDIANAARCYDLALKLAEQIGSEVEMRLSRERLAALPAH